MRESNAYIQEAINNLPNNAASYLYNIKQCVKTVRQVTDPLKQKEP